MTTSVTSFSQLQLSILLLATIGFLSSLWFHVRDKENLAIGLLVLTAFLVFSFAALLDPFLNLWDERFHALVGKNLMYHPFMPTLYDDPVVSMAYDHWDNYHIWIHKQPLFLWQIALSFKLFGISEFSLRIPDIILGMILVFIGYRSGKLLVNKNVGYLTGILTISTIYLTELVSGRQEIDHNDFSFLVYVSLSIWSLIEYHFTKKRYWIFLIGAFSGMAILCKWVVGFLVFLGWFVLKLQQKRFRPSHYYDFLVALGITLLMAVPWQVYTFICYPKEAIQAFTMNTSHFLSAVDGHRGTLLYHFEKAGTIYGLVMSLLIIPSLYVFYRNSRDKMVAVSLLVMVIAVYLFFTITATKMSSFTVVVSMVIFIALAALIDHAVQYTNRYIKKPGARSLLFAGLIILIVLLRFDIGLLRERHTTRNEENHYTRMLMHNREVFKSLNLPDNAVLFNVKGRHYLEAMFYTGLPAYNFIPTRDQYQDLKSKGRCIAIFRPADLPLPDYLSTDPTTIILNKEITGYD